MLRELIVEGLGVIERAEVSLEPGSSVLTGETGAGKTLIVAAVSLLLGGRADKTLLRAGSSEALVEARFTIPAGHPARAVLADAGLVPDGEAGTAEVVVTRSIARDARASSVRINGRLATLALLAEITTLLVEIAGQHEHQRIGTAAEQRALLDEYAGPECQRLAASVAAATRAVADAARRAEEARAGERERLREADVLAYEIAEIEKAAIAPGEIERLTEEAGRLENAEAIASAVAAVTADLRDEGGAEDLIGNAERRLRPLADADAAIGALAARLEAARYEVADVGAELQGRVVQPDPGALDRIRARLDVIAGLRRKYGDDEADILSYLQRARERADGLAELGNEADRWDKARDEAWAEARRLAAELSEVRRSAAPALAAAVESKLADLALPGARFEVRLETRDLYEGGNEAVSFLISTNEGQPPRPIAKVASGGELSRLALALHLCRRRAEVATLIFDEVDAGVGGEAARAVGGALAQLAAEQDVQVLVVTHLPQVAASAEHHYRVSKSVSGAATRSSVERVEDAARVEELSRMLAGLPESAVAKEHARELLALASERVSAA